MHKYIKISTGLGKKASVHSYLKNNKMFVDAASKVKYYCYDC